MPALRRLKEAGLRLGFLSNFSHAMLATNIKSAGLDGYFEQLLSTDQVRAFKPLIVWVSMHWTPPGEIVFAAFAGWDAAGAKSFGYPTFWVNRQNGVEEELEVHPDAVGGIDELANFVGARLSDGSLLDGGLAPWLEHSSVPLSLPLAVIMLTAMCSVHFQYGLLVRLKAVTASGTEFHTISMDESSLYRRATDARIGRTRTAVGRSLLEDKQARFEKLNVRFVWGVVKDRTFRPEGALRPLRRGTVLRNQGLQRTRLLAAGMLASSDFCTRRSPGSRKVSTSRNSTGNSSKVCL